MRSYTRHYIDGTWIEGEGAPLDVIDPATEQVAGRIALGTRAEVDRAVAAARRAFPAYAATSREDRLALLRRIHAELDARADEMALAVSEEMGAPAWLARDRHVWRGLAHLQTAIEVLERFAFEEHHGTTLVRREPIGVAGMITPWNWPLNQIAAKVAPALATGCAMVLKPSEIAPFSGHIWAEVLDAAGVPAGVFNLVQGDGAGVGAALSAHPDIDMVSFTGSTRAGIEVARAAAPTIKRVTQELGGKSANILLPDADFARAVPAGVKAVMLNSGQTCTALTRMLVPRARMDEAAAIAAETADAISVGPSAGNAEMGPLASEAGWEKVQALIRQGVAEGARLVAGGPGRPEGLDRGYYARPTVFADVEPGMTVAEEEIFGPVLSIIGYDGIDHAVEIANASPYGLSGAVQGADREAAVSVAARIRTGMVHLNGAAGDLHAPFGGYKQSGNGREWGEHGFLEYLEVKAVMGAFD